MMESVLTFGEALLAFVPDQPGPLADASGFHLHVAGAELNTAVGLSRLGISAQFAGAIGADALGDKIVKTLRAEGVDPALIERTDECSSPLFVKEQVGLPLQTHVHYYRNQSPMAKGYWTGDLAFRAIEEGRFAWAHATGITWAIGKSAEATAQKILEQAHQAGVTTSFDINMRLKMRTREEWRDILYQVLPFCDWLFLSDEEARLLLDEDDAGVLEPRLRERGFEGQGVVIKAGDRGVRVSVHGQEESALAWKASVVDTVGAGDGFNAGFICGMLRGYPLADALRLGALVGAYAVTVKGDFDGYPTWAQASQDLHGGPERLR